LAEEGWVKEAAAAREAKDLVARAGSAGSAAGSAARPHTMAGSAREAEEEAVARAAAAAAEEAAAAATGLAAPR